MGVRGTERTSRRGERRGSRGRRSLRTPCGAKSSPRVLRVYCAVVATDTRGFGIVAEQIKRQRTCSDQELRGMSILGLNRGTVATGGGRNRCSQLQNSSPPTSRSN